MEIIQRPYPPTGLTTQRWKDEVPVEYVYLHQLVFTQSEISLIKVLESLQGKPNFAGDDYPHVVSWNNTLYLEDGHHRVAGAILRGDTATILARVFDSPGQ